MGIQIIAVVFMGQYLMKLNSLENQKQAGFGFKSYVISIVLLVLFTTL